MEKKEEIAGKEKKEEIAGKQFPIVGMGASAGGLEAFETFFDSMPLGSGLAFVLVSHLDPNHISILPQLIQKMISL